MSHATTPAANCPTWCTRHTMENDKTTVASHERLFHTPEGIDMFLWQGADDTAPALHLYAVGPDSTDADEIAWFAREVAAASRMLAAPAEPLVVAPIATPTKMDHHRDDGLSDAYGSCTEWCYYPAELGGGQTRGNPVADHGLWCNRSVGSVDGYTEDGHEARTIIAIAHPYFHGTYPAEARKNRNSQQAYVELDLDEHAEPHYYTVGEARRMIAILQRAVDELDDLNRPLSGGVR